ncbi:flagellin [Priestia koreensis]|uniref:flagellin N-terminal helical domain-containing protein n=1 Tax=Priestia koreensis TaxID=284581 RepID=UPI00203F253D|nr:flagellin [Priestia koreensis]MCM3005692.1 hypothetical protein [Priestia koreensis]
MINSIRTNNIGTKINHQIYASDERIKETMQKLSSGLRINKASDDAAGLSISERLKAQSRGLVQSKNNLNDGISLVQTADGGLQTIGDILQRVRELTVQGRNGTLSSQDKLTIDNEISTLLQSIDGIAKKTTFNGINLLNETPSVVQTLGDTWTPPTPVSAISYPKDVASNGSIMVALKTGRFLYSTDGTTWSNGTGATPPFSPANVIWAGSQFIASSSSGIFSSSDGINWVRESTVDANGGIAYNGSTYVISNLGNTYSGTTAKIFTSNDLTNWTEQTYAPSSKNLSTVGVQDGKFILNAADNYQHLKSSDGINWAPVTFAEVYGNLPTTPREITEANGKYYAAVGSNGIYVSDDRTNWTKYTNAPAGYYQEVEFDNVNNRLIAITENGSVTISQGVEGDEPLTIHSGTESNNTYGIELSDVTLNSLGINSLSVNDPTALQKIDAAIQKINDERTKYGIAQNRMEFKLENLSTSHISTEQTNQRISGADMTLESSALMKEQIKNQTAMAMLQKSYANMESKLTLLQS